MKITAFDIADSPQARDFVSGLGSGTTPTITAGEGQRRRGQLHRRRQRGDCRRPQSGDTIEWTTSPPHDRALIEGVAGKFDIGAFAITQANPTPDQRLDFVAKATDGDGDTKTAGFSIGIDGTGTIDDGLVAGVVVSSASTLFSSDPITRQRDEVEELLA